MFESRFGKKVAAANGDPSSRVDIIDEEAIPTAVNAPKPIEAPPIIINLFIALRSKDIKNATTPSNKIGSDGEKNIANSPSMTIIMASTALRKISADAGPNLASNHKSLRRTNAPTRDLARALTAKEFEYSSSRYCRSINFISQILPIGFSWI
jgi:hypothetical protein